MTVQGRDLWVERHTGMDEKGHRYTVVEDKQHCCTLLLGWLRLWCVVSLKTSKLGGWYHSRHHTFSWVHLNVALIGTTTTFQRKGHGGA